MPARNGGPQTRTVPFAPRIASRSRRRFAYAAAGITSGHVAHRRRGRFPSRNSPATSNPGICPSRNPSVAASDSSSNQPGGTRRQLTSAAVVNKSPTHAGACCRFKSGLTPAPSAATLWHKSNNAQQRRRRLYSRYASPSTSECGLQTPASTMQTVSYRHATPFAAADGSVTGMRIVAAGADGSISATAVIRRRGRFRFSSNGPSTADGLVSPVIVFRCRRRFRSHRKSPRASEDGLILAAHRLA